MIKTPLKRKRSENWLEEDKILLTEMIKERVSILENKNTDANTNSKKVAAWQDLLTSFNAMAKTNRTLHQIKSQWCTIKIAEKKKRYVHRKEVIRTGGGPPPPMESPSGDDIAVWLPNEFVVDYNEFDSDSQMPEPSTSKEIISLIDKVDTMPQPSTSKEIISLIDKVDTMPQPSTSKEIISLIDKVDTICEEPEPSISHKKADLTIKAKQYKQTAKNAKVKSYTQHAVQKICNTEIACRRELHAAQMGIENQKLKNLKLKEELLKLKILYYKTKTE